MALNVLSTTMMARRGFVLDNIMTWVRPSNNKLIDRASRYLIQLAHARHLSLEYDQAVHLVVEVMEKSPQSAVVITALEKLQTKG
jgi:N-acetylmuramic acid 6-phosphate etherase